MHITREVVPTIGWTNTVLHEAADLGSGLETISNILPEVRTPKDMPTGEDHVWWASSLSVADVRLGGIVIAGQIPYSGASSSRFNVAILSFR
ncbi:hypothetical protein LB503_003983, partial [Fusarium chuoi]